MKTIFYSWFAACAVTACAVPDDTTSVSSATVAPAPPARLKVKQGEILDPAGDPIVLRGYNWGQWGTADLANDPGDNLAQGANSVRIPLRWWGDWQAGVDSRVPDYPYIDDAHWKLLKQTVRAATAAHLWVTIFIDSNEGQGANDEHNGYTNFWTAKGADDKAQFVEVWKTVVKEFSNDPYIAAYEILPEPRPTHLVDGEEAPFSNDDVRAFYDSIIPEIRALDKRTPIVVGPNDAYNPRLLQDAITDADPTGNVIYTADYFIYDDGNTEARIKPIDDFLATGHALWINQVGIRSGYADPFCKAQLVLNDFAARDVGWAWWTYRADTLSPDEHGIFYKNADGSWHKKKDWYRFIGDHFEAATTNCADFATSIAP